MGAHRTTSRQRPRVVVLDACPVQAGRTRTALRRAGHLVLGADDARTALQLVPSAGVPVADPAATTEC
jgi:hypothetical protein